MLAKAPYGLFRYGTVKKGAGYNCASYSARLGCSKSINDSALPQFDGHRHGIA
jgi:hypothetical protein